MHTGRFKVVAMGGNFAVELNHEWSGTLEDYKGPALSSSGSDPAARAFAREHIDPEGRFIWADTGRAIMPLRYYLTPADLVQANSQLDNSDREDYHRVEVKVLEDDPAAKCQTVQVTEYDEKNDEISVYRVQNECVQPIGWSRLCPLMILAPIVLIMCPLIFGVSYVLWTRLLGKKLLTPASGPTN